MCTRSHVYACAPMLQRLATGAPCQPAALSVLVTVARLQVWYDSPASLAAKYRLAAELGLRGVGMWHLDCLDYSCSEPHCRDETRAVWAAVRAFTGHDRPLGTASNSGSGSLGASLQDWY